MEKPITLIISETKNEIVNAINQSNLPLFVIEPMIKGLYEEISFALKTQADKDLLSYKAALEQELKESEAEPPQEKKES